MTIYKAGYVVTMKGCVALEWLRIAMRLQQGALRGMYPTPERIHNKHVALSDLWYQETKGSVDLTLDNEIVRVSAIGLHQTQ